MNVKQNDHMENEVTSKSSDIYKTTGFGQLDSKKLTLLDLLYGGTQLVSGHHVIWASIVYGLTRKKKTILLTMISKGLIEFLLSDPWGLTILFVNFMEGVCLVGGFFFMEKLGEGETKLGWGIAGGFGNFFQAPFFWIVNMRWYLPWTLWLLAFMFAYISGILIVGLLGRSVKNYLIEAGVPTTF
jgi:ABC-type thiamin/hydroxymethylpyrimidine transport system permease subunit